jgi:hypothetical protein
MSQCRICFSHRMVDWKMSSAPACPICRGSITTVLVDMTKRYEIEVESASLLLLLLSALSGPCHIIKILPGVDAFLIHTLLWLPFLLSDNPESQLFSLEVLNAALPASASKFHTPCTQFRVPNTDITTLSAQPPQKLPSLANLPAGNLTDAQISTDMVYFSGPPGPTPNQTSASGPAGQALLQAGQGASDGVPIVASSVPLMQTDAAHDQQNGLEHQGQEQQLQRVSQQPSSASLGRENQRDDEHPAAYSMNSHPQNAPASSTDSFPGLISPARPRQLSTTAGTPVRVTPRLHNAEPSAHNLTSSVVIRDVKDDARSSGSAVPEAAAEALESGLPSINYPNYPM